MFYPGDNQSLIDKGIMLLLQIKDSDTRLMNLYQCRYAVDNSIHIGGASSATIPMVSLFYGGIIDVNVEQPTALGQDMFVLSKGHAVATLASIYADLGYFDRSVLKNSRSVSSILNGHPGPLLPGVHVATGPMGQGLGVAQGFAIAGQRSPHFDVYAITGDGELQEGPIWESVMFSGYKRLDNLCVLVDNNEGQLDIVTRLHFPYHSLKDSFSSFGWKTIEVDATRYHTVYHALLEFKHGERDGRPTVIICKSTKGHGGLSDYMNTHKATIPANILDLEEKMQVQQRRAREKEFFQFFDQLTGEDHAEARDTMLKQAAMMNLRIEKKRVVSVEIAVKTKKAPVRDKKIKYASADLPRLEKGKPYGANKIIELSMKAFARDERIYSVDADLASTSGLQAGVGFVDKYRALNAGVAEANMMLLGEAFAILGANAWVSTFCPFFDWKVMRRAAVGHQERLEVMAQKDGWLSEGHGLDLTMVATAADLETQANGATHMGNDDVTLFKEIAQLKIINVSCPQQLMGVMKWIMEGNKGMVYMRVLRAPATVIYDDGFTFEFGRAYKVKYSEDAEATMITSSRGVYEALDAAGRLEEEGIHINVMDMPSVDEDAIVELYHSGKPIIIAEQNNGYLWSHFRRVLFEKETDISTQNLIPVNTRTKSGLQFIHSGTYTELAAHFELDGSHLYKKVLAALKQKAKANTL